MNDFKLYRETGHAELPPFRANPKLSDPALYLPSKGLLSAVNVALGLARPLLLTGEPGTGKTELAAHVARFFGLGKPVVFDAQTTSTARDLFYRYDTLGHFQWTQNPKNPALSPDEMEEKFIRYEALGQAIVTAARTGRRSIVLLDELDKAPRDLPNDVLAAIEKLEFNVPEIPAKPMRQWACPRDCAPVILITSNSEKNLPDAFLRRVVFFHIEFPKSAELLRILAAKTDGFEEADLKAVVAHFEEIRAGKDLKLRKKPATAELIQWAALLRSAGFPAAKLRNPDSLDEAERAFLLTSYSVLAKGKEDLKALMEWI